MKKIFFILFIPLIIACNACNNYPPEYVPFAFQPLDNTEDIVVVTSSLPNQWNKSELIAIDTKKSKAVQIYRFNTMVINFSRLTNSGFFYIELYSPPELYCLNLKTGKTKKVFSGTIWDQSLNGDNLLFTDDYNHTESYMYNPYTDKLTKFKTAYAITSDCYTNNGNEYCVMYNRSADPEENWYYLYNLTKNQRIELSYENDPNDIYYQPFDIRNNKYLISKCKEGYCIDEIVSFEPENLIRICDVGHKFINNIYEDENFIYCSGNHCETCKISKSMKKIVAQTDSSVDYSTGSMSVIRNGYAWIGAGDSGTGSGDFFRIELADDDGDGVLKCELIKYE